MQGPRQIPPGRRGFRTRQLDGLSRVRPEAGEVPPLPRAQRVSRVRTPSRGEETPLPIRRETPTHWIYLHGFGSDPMSPKAQFFNQQFRAAGLPIVVPDLNVPSFEQLTITACLAEVERVISGFPSEAKVGIVGSSLGGLIALFAADRCKNVSYVMLLAPALGLFRVNFVGLGKPGVRAWERNGFLEVFHSPSNRNRRLSADFVADARQYDERNLRLSIPVTIVHGQRDEVVDPHLSITYARAHHNVKLHLVDDDHSLLASITQIWEWLRMDTRPRPNRDNASAH